MGELAWSLTLVCLIPMGYTIGLLLIGYWAGSRGFVLRSPFARKDDLHED